MKLYLLISFFIFSLSAFGQTAKARKPITEIEAITKDGKTVILKSNGTWRYSPATTAQSPAAPILPPKTEEAKFTPKTVELLQKEGESFSPGVFETKYDEFTNFTIFNTKTTSLTNKQNHSLRFYASVIFRTNTLTAAPEKYDFVVFSSSDEWRFLTSNSLIFLADGERIYIDFIRHDGSLSSYGGVREALYYKIDAKDLLKIGNAKSVRFQLGLVEGELNESDINTLRQLHKMTH